MKFWIILVLLAISTRASFATFALIESLLQGVNAGYAENIGLRVGPVKFGLNKKVHLNLGGYGQETALVRPGVCCRNDGTQDYPNYSQESYPGNYPYVPVSRHGQENYPANYPHVPVRRYGQENYPANYPHAPVPRHGQENYPANYPQVPVPTYSQGNYSGDYFAMHADNNVPSNTEIMQNTFTTYGAAAPIFGIGLNAGLDAIIGLRGRRVPSQAGIYGSPYPHHVDYPQEVGVGLGVGIGASLGLGAGSFY
uniref:Uncharacterized protein n=1 Tax=Glossina palpalis gambiensis TaxID=67801 RepID=A0A1B0C7X6_9MUSC